MAFLAAAGRWGGAYGTMPALQYQHPASVGARPGRSGDPLDTGGAPAVCPCPHRAIEPFAGTCRRSSFPLPLFPRSPRASGHPGSHRAHTGSRSPLWSHCRTPHCGQGRSVAWSTGIRCGVGANGVSMDMGDRSPPGTSGTSVLLPLRLLVHSFLALQHGWNEPLHGMDNWHVVRD